MECFVGKMKKREMMMMMIRIVEASAGLRYVVSTLDVGFTVFSCLDKARKAAKE